MCGQRHTSAAVAARPHAGPARTIRRPGWTAPGYGSISIGFSAPNTGACAISTATSKACRKAAATSSVSPSGV